MRVLRQSLEWLRPREAQMRSALTTYWPGTTSIGLMGAATIGKLLLIKLGPEYR